MSLFPEGSRINAWNAYRTNAIAGVSLYGKEFTAHAAYVFPRVLMRNNVIGYFNNGSDTRMDPDTAGLTGSTMDSGILDQNIIDVVVSNTPKQCLEGESRWVSYFNNRDSTGKLLRGYNLDTSSFKDELEDQIESAVLASFL